MRIAIVHSFYRSDQPSGENRNVETEAGLLREAGHEVLLVSRSSDQAMTGALAPLRAGVTVATGLGPNPTEELRRFMPDVVHVHNLFPNFGTRWLKTWSGPVVATLHNYRTVCANGLLFRERDVCTDCIASSSAASLKYGCYRGSRMQTLPLMISTREPSRNPIMNRANRIIVLSDRQAAVFKQPGYRWSHKIVVIPHGIPPFGVPAPPPPEQRWIAVGRLSAAKGFRELIESWPTAVALDIVGSGAELADLREAAPPCVRILGERPPEWLRANLSGYSGLIFPSRWYEPYGLVVAEALSSGLPVAARANTSGADMVGALDPTWVFGDGRSLGEALRAIVAQGESARIRALQFYHSHLRPQEWLNRLEETFGLAIDEYR